MSARLDTVAKHVCERAQWRLSNLPLQKLVYLAQLEHLGETAGKRLVDTAFEAWDLGPVSPDLYRKVKLFGAGPVGDVFYKARVFSGTDPRRSVLDRIVDQYLGKRPGELVALTHWKLGAWSKKYEPSIRGIQITDEDIIDEYRNRQRFPDAWQSVGGR